MKLEVVKSDYAPDHAFLCHLKDVLGGLEGQLPFKLDTYSIEYMYSEIISTDVVENRDILYRSSSSNYIEHRQ
jgi:hypothetical protein